MEYYTQNGAKKLINDEAMKQYFKTLWTALTGCNPYAVELEQVRREYEATANDVTIAKELYMTCAERIVEYKKQTAALQNLTETLRQHLAEKDELMERMKQDYHKRIEAYNVEIDKLRKAKAN